MSVQRVEAAAQAVEDARLALKAEMLHALNAGVSKSKIARAAKTSRPTTDAWIQEARELQQ